MSIPVAVMKDDRLTIEAKGIYAYLACQRNQIVKDLGISLERYYKHLNHLIQHDYVEVKQTRTKQYA